MKRFLTRYLLPPVLTALVYLLYFTVKVIEVDKDIEKKL
ncbi:hypothetical protein MNBD_NITROSPINAE03-178, partial [hydrothermal vent metagenome]